MKKKISTLFITAIALIVVISACQKDDALKSEQQLQKSGNIQKEGLAKEVSDSTPPDNLPGPHNNVQSRGPIGEVMMFCSLLDKVEIYNKDGQRHISVKMKKLSPVPNFSKGNEFIIEVWDYAVERNWLFFKNWHKRHVVTMEVKQNYIASTSILPGDLFTGKGTGRRELWVYLGRKFNGTLQYKNLHSKEYSENNKNIFDDYKFISPLWFAEDLCR
ncbi:MAG: hypothetical protein ACQPRH_04140 [Solitalea-like symbiont of Tyrophagus putrescentiae]